MINQICANMALKITFLFEYFVCSQTTYVASFINSIDLTIALLTVTTCYPVKVSVFQSLIKNLHSLSPTSYIKSRKIGTILPSYFYLYMRLSVGCL